MRYNNRGTPVLGLGKRWLTDERQIFQAETGPGQWNIIDQHGLLIAPGGAAYLAANAGKWADTTGAMRSNFGYDNPFGKVWDIGFDGMVIDSPSAFEGNQVGLWRSGQPYLIGPIADARADHAGGCVVCFYDRRIMSSRVGSRGYAVLPKGVIPFSAVLFEDFLLYHTHRWLVLQRFGIPQGRVIAEAPTFSPDMVWLSNGYLRIGWCQNVGETPDSYRFTDALLAKDFTDLAGLTDEPPIVIPPRPPQPPEAPVSETIPADVWATVKAVHAAYRDSQDWTPDEDGARVAMQMIIGQVAHDHPGQGWCWKQSTRNSPPSKDCLAREWRGRFMGWDIFIGAGRTGPRVLAETPAFHDLTGQVPIWVEPKDVLGHAQPEPEPEPPPVDDSIVATLRRELASLRGEVDALAATSVRYGHRLAIRTDTGNYYCAEGGGGGDVNATRSAVGAWETVQLERQG